MGRSIRSRLVAAVIAAVAGLGILTSAAFAQNHGASGFHSQNSCNSTSGGIENATFNSAAGGHARSVVIQLYGRFGCD